MGEKRFYEPDDLKGWNPSELLGNPGGYPFTRGVYAEMYAKQLWTMRQYAGYGNARETNRRYRYLLDQGQTGLSVAFDLPTQLGYDSDHSLSQGEVGKAGVAVSCLADMETLFDSITLDRVSTSMTINATAPILLALYIAVGKRQGVSQERLSGTVQNDILKEYVARGNYIYPVEFSMRLVTDIFAYCAKHLPKWNTISISGYHIREKGATAAQELAFTLANGIAYVEGALARGLAVDAFATRLSFFFNAHNNLFEEVAKFRAGRRIWARIMKERFGAKDPRSTMLRFHTQTAGSMLTAQQPENNLIRVTLQALAAVLGGTQSLHTNSFDEALCLPTQKAVTLALRTQQIIAHESGVPEVADPLGGSYYVESLTNRLEEEVWEYLKKIEDQGGAIACVRSGYFQREIEESAFRYQQAVDRKEKVVVGVNAYASEGQGDGNEDREILRVDPALEGERNAFLSEWRKKRDRQAAETALQDVIKITKTEENLMPSLIEAVEAGVTLGEVCDAWRREYGEYKTP
jgi:methylmalonyl-CoA mutase N-terminal domain/subunit